jgi:predicted nucleic acid-binding protein
MISLTDASVFVAAVDKDHPHHPRSFAIFNRLSRPEAKCGAHTLAEVYSVLTRLPPTHRLSREQALLFVEQIVQRVEPVSLGPDEYLSALRKAVADGVGGGRIYDALHVACARKVGADVIYTWDLGDFRAVASDLIARIVEP